MLLHEDVTHRIIEAAMKVHSALGPGMLESTYGACIQYEFNNTFKDNPQAPEAQSNQEYMNRIGQQSKLLPLPRNEQRVARELPAVRLSAILERYDFRSVGREAMDGRPAIVLEFTAIPGSRPVAHDDVLRNHLRNIEAYVARLSEDVVQGREQSVHDLRGDIRVVARTIAALAEDARR